MVQITVAARSSPLSRAQVDEVLTEIRKFHPEVSFNPTYIPTHGDQNQTVSLRSLGKSDFFTREVDQLLLLGQCRVAIHSAKDLPEIIPEGLCFSALTQGHDPSDSLVLRPNETLKSLPHGAVVATSSERREEMVGQLRSDLSFKDLRGTIHQRLAKLETGEADAVVIAEAALIRLGLTHLNRIKLPGETVPYQGQLAIFTRENDHEMQELFSCLDMRSTLYLGLEPPLELPTGNRIHCPIIQIVPRNFQGEQIQAAFKELPKFTHLIFTSKNGVRLFFRCLFDMGWQKEILQNKQIIVVGQATGDALKPFGMIPHFIAKEETAEGIVQELQKLPLEKCYFFWPHAAKARSVISDFLISKKGNYCECILYETIPNRQQTLPDLKYVRELIFTSPSTVDAFIELFGSIPTTIKKRAIGPVTLERLTAACHLSQ